MSERYSRLFSLPENLYSTGSPLLIEAGALLKDNQSDKILAQLKFHSLSIKSIKAVTVALYAKDVVGNRLGDKVEYQYLDLTANRDSTFGQKTPIVLPDATTRSFSAEIIGVVFSDNTLWSGSNEQWEPFPPKIPLPDVISDLEMQKQYRLELGNNKNFVYKEYKDLWYCSCGALNHNDEGCCHTCQSQQVQFKNLDLLSMRFRKDERLDEEEKQQKIKEKKWKKFVSVTILTCCTAAIFVFILNTFHAFSIPFSANTSSIIKTPVRNPDTKLLHSKRPLVCISVSIYLSKAALPSADSSDLMISSYSSSFSNSALYSFF